MPFHSLWTEALRRWCHPPAPVAVTEESACVREMIRWPSLWPFFIIWKMRPNSSSVQMWGEKCDFSSRWIWFKPTEVPRGRPGRWMGMAGFTWSGRDAVTCFQSSEVDGAFTHCLSQASLNHYQRLERVTIHPRPSSGSRFLPASLTVFIYYITWNASRSFHRSLLITHRKHSALLVCEYGNYRAYLGMGRPRY